MNSEPNIFESFLNDNGSENSMEYTEVQLTSPSCSFINDTSNDFNEYCIKYSTQDNKPIISNCQDHIQQSDFLAPDPNYTCVEDASSQNLYSLTMEDKIHLKNLLENWNMGYLFQTCVAQSIDIEALKYIKTDQISILLSKYPLGVINKFEHNVKQWQKNRQLNTSEENKLRKSISSSKSISTSYQVQQFSLDEILNKNSQGALIINYYKTNNNLNESCRILMLDIIISDLVEKNISMSVVLADTVASTISETFPTELKETYFVRNTDNKCPKGKLYAKYFNKLRSLKNHGLISQRPASKKNSNTKLTRVSAGLNDELTIEENATVLISHLKHNDMAWSEVEIIWKQTSAYRLRALKDTNFSHTEIQKNWPHYTKPLGYKLIDIDFQCLYKNAKDMLIMYDNSITKLIKILDERVKDPSNRKLLTTMMDNNKASENSKNSVVFYNLHALFVPTSKKSYTDTKGKTCIIKYSISDSQKSCVDS